MSTLNPDASGKMVFDLYLNMGPMAGMNMGEGADKPDPAKMVTPMLQGLVSQTKGADAWANLAGAAEKDGRIHVSGTVYFADVNKFESKQLGSPKVSFQKDSKGGMVLELKEEEKSSAPPVKEADMAKAIADAKAQYQQAKPMMAMMFTNLKLDFTYMLPGKLGETGIFEKTDKGGLRLVVEGKKMSEAMDKVMADDKLLTETIKAGRDPIKQGPAMDQMNEMVFGRKGQSKATVTGELKPLFDYKAEVEKAKAAQPAMLKKLGLPGGA